MPFTFETQGNQTNLIYRIQPGDRIDTMSMGMLSGNQIPGLALTSYAQRDEDKYIIYNATAKIPMRQMVDNVVRRNQFLKITSGICNALLTSEEYMIRPESILLDLDYIFINVVTHEPTLICLPLMNQETHYDARNFFKNLMFQIRYDQTENCDYVTHILNYINANTAFSVSGFRDVLLSLDHSGSAAIGTSAMQPAPVYPAASPQMPPPVQGVSFAPQVSPAQMPQSGFASSPSRQASWAPAEPAVSPQPPVQPAAMPMQPPAPVVQPQDMSALASDASSNAEKMSLMYLLRHYTKENAEIYKQQKGNKNQAPAPTKSKKAKGSKQQPASHTPNDAQMLGSGGSVPSNPGGFYVPGAQQPVGVNPPQPVPQGIPYQAPGAVTYSERNGDFGDTSYFDDEDDSGTNFLDEESSNGNFQLRPHLTRKKNGENIPLNKAVFRIGRHSDYNDYTVTDNKYIGNTHCHIITRNNEYFIIDSNSKNHTYVDGVMVQPGTEVKLSHGQIIRLANEDFEFGLY